jgi:hypothetical protein
VNVELPRRETNSASTSKTKTDPSFNHLEQNRPVGKPIRSDLLEQLGLTYDRKKENYPKVQLSKHKQNLKHAMQSDTCAGVVAHAVGLLRATLSIVGAWRVEAETIAELSTAGIWRARNQDHR